MMASPALALRSVATTAQWEERLPPAVREAAAAKRLGEPVVTVHHLAKSACGASST